MTIKNILITSILLTSSSTAIAELFVSPISKNYKEASISFGKSDVDYDAGNLERTFISGSYSLPQSDKLNLFAFGQFGFDVEDGDGFIFGGGAKGPLAFSSGTNINLHWYSQFAYLSEDYGTENNVSQKGSGYEILLGLVSVHSLDSNLTVWGGLEIIPLSDLEVEVVGTFTGREEFNLADVQLGKAIPSTGTVEFERDDMLGLRLGAEYGSLSFSLSLMNETTVMIGYRKPLGSVIKSTRYRPKNKISAQPEKVYRSPPQPAPVSVSSPTPLANEQPYFTGSPVLQAQQALSSMGYDPGPIDGVMGARTQSALKKLQQDQGLPVTGTLDSSTRAALGIE